MSIQAQILTSGTAVQSAAADNAIATATVPAITGMTQRLIGIWADYDVAENSIRSITVTGDVTLVFLWDFTDGSANIALPGPIRSALGGAITVALQASGTGSTSGRVIAFHFPY